MKAEPFGHRFIIAACLFLAACLGPEESSRQAKAAVEAMGFTDVTITKPGFFICNQDSDVYRWHWTGKNINGRLVEGQACGGMWFKGWTVRIGG